MPKRLVKGTRVGGDGRGWGRACSLPGPRRSQPSPRGCLCGLNPRAGFTAAPQHDSEGFKEFRQRWGNADGCPLLLCRQRGLAHLPAPADLLAAPPILPGFGGARAVPSTLGTTLFLGQSLQETARSPGLRDLWTLENLKRPSAHPNHSPAPLPQIPPTLHPTEPFLVARWGCERMRYGRVRHVCRRGGVAGAG